MKASKAVEAISPVAGVGVVNQGEAAVIDREEAAVINPVAVEAEVINPVVAAIDRAVEAANPAEAGGTSLAAATNLVAAEAASRDPVGVAAAKTDKHSARQSEPG